MTWTMYWDWLAKTTLISVMFALIIWGVFGIYWVIKWRSKKNDTEYGDSDG